MKQKGGRGKFRDFAIIALLSVGAILLVLIFLGALAALGKGEFYNFIKDFQTLIGAIIGFGGLILAALWGFKHSIASSEREAETARKLASEQRDQEMRALAAALSGEFDVISKSIAILQAQVERQQVENEASPVALWKPTTEIFKNNTVRLGLLGARMARHVTHVSALAGIASDSVAINWACLSKEQDRADRIKKKIDDFAKEAEAISFQLEFVADGHDPNDILDKLTAEDLEEMRPSGDHPGDNASVGAEPDDK